MPSTRTMYCNLRFVLVHASTAAVHQSSPNGEPVKTDCSTSPNTSLTSSTQINFLEKDLLMCTIPQSVKG